MLKAILIRIGVTTVLFVGVCLLVIYYINETRLQNEIKAMDFSQKNTLKSEYFYSRLRYKNFLDTMNLFLAEVLAEANKTSNQATIDRIQKKLSKLVKLHDFIEVYMAPLDGTLIASSGYQMNAREQARPWFMHIIDGNDYYQSDFYESITGGLVVTFSVPVKFNGEIIGVAGIDIDGTKFISAHLEYALSDKNGLVFSSDPTNVEFLGKNIYEMRPAFLKASQDPMMYTNDKGGIFSITKTTLDDGNILFSILPLNKSVEKNYGFLKEIAVIIFAFLIIIMIINLGMLSKELKVIKRIADLVKTIGDGHLINASIDANYEFGHISKIINELTKKLSVVISKSQEIMWNIKTKQILAVELVEKNRTNCLNELSFVEDVKGASAELATTAMNVASNAAQAEQATIEANHVIDSSQSILTNATEANEQINTSFFEAKETVNQLREHSEKISTVVDVIKNISEQTNLLALNAAIEAARAGAQGRGFAVVADEVRALAAKTQKSTIDIQNIITQLQEKSKHANDYMNQNVELMKLTQEAMEELKHSFNVISNKVAGISQINTTVASASEEQNVVTQEISKQLENMNSLVQQNLEGIEQSSQSNQEVSGLAELLQSELSFFKVKNGSANHIEGR